MTELAPGLCSGQNSLWANAVAMGPTGGSAETLKMMPPGWAGDSPNETRSGTVYENAVRGLWLPLFIPEGCDGHIGQTDPVTGELLPEVIFYAANGVAGMLDGQFGARTPENERARYDQAVAWGLEAGSSTSGGGFVRENP